MKSHVLKALRLYGWLSLAFVVLYVPYVVYDDFALIKNIKSPAQLPSVLLISALFMFSYFLMFTMTYCAAALLVILGLYFRERVVASPRCP